MKLNLLPTSVSKASQTRNAVAATIGISALAIIVAVVMILGSKKKLDSETERATNLQGDYTRVDALSKSADAIVQRGANIQRNIALTEAMNKHNSEYINLYRVVLGYVPKFFRVTAMSAAPTGPENAVVNITGILNTYQEYADLMLALMRVPGATNVSRSGYNVVDPVVPQLREADQLGIPVRPGETPLPSDPWQRFQALLEQGRQTPSGYQGIGNFGAQDRTAPRGAMTGYSEITIVLQISGVLLQTPDPGGTLSKPMAAAAPGAGTSGGTSTMPASSQGQRPVGTPGGGRPESDQ